MLGLAQFEKEDAERGAKVQPLFITVDPARDTAEALKPFVERYHPRLAGLTGTPDQIAAVTKSYAVTYNKVPGSAPDRYLMAHSQLAFLMDPEGKPLALLPLDDSFTDEDEGKPELVAAELKKWVK
jgi:protein SCO1/2